TELSLGKGIFLLPMPARSTSLVCIPLNVSDVSMVCYLIRPNSLISGLTTSIFNSVRQYRNLQSILLFLQSQ
ncbi:hypothetical protein J1N12_22460, partial [Marinilabiliaceae bacterium A049]|nr:hypothetical protein [Marinilabiliaceae bacterium A049]